MAHTNEIARLQLRGGLERDVIDVRGILCREGLEPPSLSTRDDACVLARDAGVGHQDSGRPGRAADDGLVGVDDRIDRRCTRRLDTDTEVHAAETLAAAASAVDSTEKSGRKPASSKTCRTESPSEAMASFPRASFVRLASV